MKILFSVPSCNSIFIYIHIKKNRTHQATMYTYLGGDVSLNNELVTFICSNLFLFPIFYILFAFILCYQNIHRNARGNFIRLVATPSFELGSVSRFCRYTFQFCILYFAFFPHTLHILLMDIFFIVLVGSCVVHIP